MFKKGIKLFPNYGSLYIGLGKYYQLTGKNDKAITQFQKAVKKGPQADIKEAYRYLGEIYYTRPKGKNRAEDFFTKYLNAGGNRETVTLFKAKEDQKVKKQRIAVEEVKKTEKEQGKKDTQAPQVIKEKVTRSKTAKGKGKKDESSPDKPFSIADEIRKFAELRNAGIITEEEFAEQKKRLLEKNK